jgi:Ca2+-transporting ATPase
MNMWKMIVGQTAFQLAVTVTLYFAGARMLGYDAADEHRMLQLSTMVFNTFVWMQIFNEFNCRRLDNDLNVLEGLQRNPYFVCINLFMVGCQVAVVFIGHTVFSVTPLDGVQWAVCVAVPLLSIPWAMVVRSFPDALFARIVGLVCGPFVMAYAVMARIFAPVARLLTRKAKNNADGDSEKGRS